MKQYKHKATGNIAVETHSGNNYRVTVPQNYTVPKWIVENSDEWEEFLNYDGVEFYSTTDINTVYTIKKYDLRNKFFNVFWTNCSRDTYHVTYKKEDLDNYFKDGTWIKIEKEELSESLSIHDLRKVGISFDTQQYYDLVELVKKK